MEVSAAVATTTMEGLAAAIMGFDTGVARSEPRKAYPSVVDTSIVSPICSSRHVSVRHYTWEPSRWAGDALHIIALVLCLAVVLRESGPEGVSMKTHLFLFIVYTSRFINIFFCPQAIYLIIYKVLIWQATVMIVTLMAIRRAWEDRRDTLPPLAVIVPTCAATLLFGRFSSNDYGRIAEIIWIFSLYLEAVAMLPQYIYCYRDKTNRSPLAFWYVQAMGAYRVVFGLTWVYHSIVSTEFLEVSSLVSGILGLVFFADYLVFTRAKHSPLAQLCISMDEGIREAEEAARGAMLGEHMEPWEALKHATALAAAEAEAEERKTRVGVGVGPRPGTDSRGLRFDVEMAATSVQETPSVMSVKKGRLRDSPDKAI